eukprot:6185400-Pleurochrysis_carterae.AAC.3
MLHCISSIHCAVQPAETNTACGSTQAGHRVAAVARSRAQSPPRRQRPPAKRAVTAKRSHADTTG